MATNLQFIKSAEITTQSASLSVTDVFSARYDNYVIMISNMVASADDNMRFTYIDASGEVTASNYDYAEQILYSSTGFGTDKHTGQTSAPLGAYGLQGTEEGMGMEMTVYNPFNATYTFSSLLIGYHAGTSNTELARKGYTMYDTTGSMTGIKFKFASSGEYEALKVNVYGIKE